MKDAVVVGSGPNGLSAAIRLAQAGAEVLVLEAKDTPGGGMRTAEITLPGFHHDLCSGCHPTGVLSPYWSTLPLAAHGLRWCFPKASVAHPLDDEPAVLLTRDVRATAENLGVDARAYERLCKPFGKRSAALLRDALAPLGVPKDPITLARFGLRALLPAQALARTVFRGPRARALLAGNAGHSVLPLDMVPSGALGLMFLVMGHAVDWPVAEGGSASITRALVSLLESLGGRVETGRFVRGLDDLPAARVYLFDTSPAQLANVCAPVLPAGYVRRLRRYRYGPGAFKVDWALSEPIPWKDPRVRDASTVHLGGTLEAIAASERAMWEGRHTDDPYMILVQQSEHDPSRAPAGQHTGYAYCHVPAGSTEDRTDVLEAQIER
ncbi:MAG: NAD(P)/FAD-dependent oxidoreductase, partial [Myxococcota bacterium]